MYPFPVFPSLLFAVMQADYNGHTIRHIILSSGVVSNLAGQAGSLGSTDGVATNARFFHPSGIALDAAGTFAVVVRMGGWRAMLKRIR